MKPLHIIQRAPNPPLTFVPTVSDPTAVTFTPPVGVATWQELHPRALTHDGSDDTVWLDAFGLRIGGSCACRKDWLLWISANPPQFGRYFEWTVAAHNAVNARLQKPILTLEEAYKIWG